MPSSKKNFDRSKAVLHLWIIFVIVTLSCLIIAALWSPAGKKANLLALLCVMFYCVFITYPCGVLGQVWHLIVSISDLCLLTCFVKDVSGQGQNTAPFAQWEPETTNNNSATTESPL